MHLSNAFLPIVFRVDGRIISLIDEHHEKRLSPIEQIGETIANLGRLYKLLNSNFFNDSSVHEIVNSLIHFDFILIACKMSHSK